jgi:diadenosine tetraphosphate (Ap4A) HIT family hydrolase
MVKGTSARTMKYINTQNLNLIYETDFWKIILNYDQKYLGRCVVVLKRKCGDLSSLYHEELLDFLDNVVIKMECALRDSFGADMFNWTCLMNNAYQEENPNPQVHWHFRPRYRKQVSFMGETFIDQNFGNHYEQGFERLVDEKILTGIVSEIRKNI